MFDRVFRSWKTSLVGLAFVVVFFMAWLGIGVDQMPFLESMAMLAIGLALVATKDEVPSWIKGWLKK